MAKNIEWIKLTVDMIDNRKIKHLRKLPEGNNIVLIWVMLLTMAGRCNAGGMIFLTEDIPYTTKMLADELDFEESTIKLALEALSKFGMIVMEEDAFYIPGWDEHQNIDGMERIREQNRLRQQKRRERMAIEKKAAIHETDFEEKSDAETVSIPCCENESDPEKESENISEDFCEENMSRYSHVTVTEDHATDIRIRNKNKNIEKDIEKKEKEKKEKVRNLYVIDFNYPDCSPELIEVLKKFSEHRKVLKKPMSQYAMDLLVKKLFSMTKDGGEQMRIEILNKSIENGWQGIFPLDNGGKCGKQEESREKKWEEYAQNDKNDGNGFCGNNGQVGKRIWERFASEGQSSV